MKENNILILNFNFTLMRDSVVNKPDAKYIIMNEETYNYLLRNRFLFLTHLGDYSTFYGIPVAVCNNKKTGEIEIV